MENKKPTALESREVTDDNRMMSPSVARNKGPILDILHPHLSAGMRVLEIASGTGEHGAHIMASVEGLIWQPSDLSPEARHSVSAWAEYSGDPNFKAPVALDASLDQWPLEDGLMFDAMLCINMIHIAPFEAAKGVMRGARRILKPGGIVFFYGPFKRGGEHTAPSNEAFDQSLKSRDAAWGIRDLEELETLAGASGLSLESLTEMPANNMSLIFRR